MERAWSLMSSGKVQANVLKVISNADIIRAMTDCQQGFQRAGKTRKLPDNYPGLEEAGDYHNHCFEVLFYLATLGYPVSVCGPSLLHDHDEDLDDWSCDRIREEYSPLWGDLVWMVTKPEHGTWDEKNDAYFARLDNPDVSQFKSETDPSVIRK